MKFTLEKKFVRYCRFTSRFKKKNIHHLCQKFHTETFTMITFTSKSHLHLYVHKKKKAKVKGTLHAKVTKSVHDRTEKNPGREGEDTKVIIHT
jgi:uroporphyrinogen-III synthase